MPDTVFKSRDGQFGLCLSPKHWQTIRIHCREANQVETGGILVGHYNTKHDIALVTRVVGPPADSHRSRSRFTRGVEKLDALLDQAWRHRRYYLGEWHWHRGEPPHPSFQDRFQMRSGTHGSAFGCTHPVLLIVGGNDRIGWSERAFVFPDGVNEIELHRVQLAHEGAS